MNNKTSKAFIPIILAFIIINGVIAGARSILISKGFDINFLIYANLLLFVISIGGFLIQRRGLQSPNHLAFVRGVYGAMMIKMFICMIAVFIYVFIYKSKINKPGLFTAMGLYIVYTVLEVMGLTKLARKKTNA